MAKQVKNTNAKTKKQPKDNPNLTPAASPEAEEQVSISAPIVELGKWKEAQKAEREQHKFSYHEGLIHYAKAYKNYFHFVGLGFDLHKLNVIEVGPADFPALGYCHNWSHAAAIEPMPSDHLKRICEEKGIGLIVCKFEDIRKEDFEPADGHKIEVWLFNVLQHVADPAAIVEKAKEIADRIRFFEPVNEPITEYHLHTFTPEDYIGWFGDCVTPYQGGQVEGFHTADCVYGIWHK